jgi:hypothetical protein
MSKSTITYVGSAADVSAWGHDFSTGKAFETDDSSIISKATANPFFKVAGGKSEDTKDQPVAKTTKLTAADRGSEARVLGKDRSVPPAYRGKPEEKEWLAAYDAPVAPEVGVYPIEDANSSNEDED